LQNTIIINVEKQQAQLSGVFPPEIERVRHVKRK